MSIDESSLWRAVHRMEEAAAKAERAADRAEEAVQRMARLLEDGYGGNGLRLIELLETTRTAHQQQEAAGHEQ